MKKIFTSIFESKENAIEATFLLVKLLDAKISRSTLKKEIFEHPDYPAFLSISDVLNNHGIETLIGRFESIKYPELPVPFLTQTNGKKDIPKYIIVKSVDSDSVQYFDPETQRLATDTLESFINNSSGIVLVAECDNIVQEKNYFNNIKEEKRRTLSQYLVALSLPLILFFSIIFAFYNEGPSVLLPSIFAIFTMLGVFVTILLLWYEVDQDNEFLQQICTQGKRTNCNSILQSKDSKIFGISWSSIGFVYFSGSFIMLIVNGITNPTSLNILSLLNLLALPYTAYSIYYQWKIAKQWCVLCLLVQALLLLQFSIAYLGSWPTLSSFDITATTFALLNTITVFSIPFIAVTLLIPIAKKAKIGNKNFLELQRLKHDPEIFNSILEKQKLIEHIPTGLGITLGNLNANTKIIKVCNPYCGPCAKAHEPIEQLLENNNDLQVQIIFTSSSDLSDRGSHPVKHLLAINDVKPNNIKNALDDWYFSENKVYEDFAIKHPMDCELKEQNEKIDAMRDWCLKTGIQFTPTFFINGYQLPANYGVNDIKYFLST